MANNGHTLPSSAVKVKNDNTKNHEESMDDGYTSQDFFRQVHAQYREQRRQQVEKHAWFTALHSSSNESNFSTDAEFSHHDSIDKENVYKRSNASSNQSNSSLPIIIEGIVSNSTPLIAPNVRNRRHEFVTPIRPVENAKNVQLDPRILCSIDMKAHVKKVTPPNAIKDSQANQESNAKDDELEKERLRLAQTSITTNAVCTQKSSEERESGAEAKSVKGNQEESKNTAREAQTINERKKIGDFVLKKTFKIIVVKNIEYIVLKVLGRGGSSIVYHCYDLYTKGEFAIKCVNLNKSNHETRAFVNEVNALKRLQKCDRIIKLYDFELVKAERILHVVMEKGGRDFGEILKQHVRRESHLPVYRIISYWMQMLQAVRQMHSGAVIHSDLKPANFVETCDHLKLIDFGISSCVSSYDATSVLKTSALGTFGYISPEAICCDHSNKDIQQYKISYKSDVWSLGCILYELVYKQTPFAKFANAHAKLAVIMDPNHTIAFPDVDWLPARLLSAMKACLQYNMRARPSIDELIKQFEAWPMD